jgi:uncharacterized damage-inducible protein DinB
MKELLKQLASYNIWATQRITEFVLSIPEDKQTAEIPSSFKSIHKTLLHMWDAETSWWQRMKMSEHIIVPSQSFNGTTKELVLGLMNQAKAWEDWVNSASELSIEHVFQYYTSKKEHVKMPVSTMLLHVFNHGTFHRGQIINMLRQLGFEKLPQTDISLLYRSKK